MASVLLADNLSFEIQIKSAKSVREKRTQSVKSEKEEERRSQRLDFL